MWFTKKKKKASAKLLSASCTEAHIKEARTEGTAVSKERSDNISSRMHGQPLEDGGEENGQSSPTVLAEEEEIEGNWRKGQGCYIGKLPTVGEGREWEGRGGCVFYPAGNPLS